jgi:tetratricopeptide (TPR) repeat protein
LKETTMPSFNFDDEFEEESPDWSKKDMDEEVRRAREAMRNERRGGNSGSAISLEALEELVLYCIETEKFDDALSFCNRLLEMMPYSADAWQKKGYVLNHLERYAEALETYDKAIELDPVDAEVHINRALTLDFLKRFDDAMASIERALELDANHEDALFAKATILERNERYEEAVKVFLYLLHSERLEKDVWYELGYCYDYLGKYEESLEAYNRHINEDPYNYNAWYNCGVVYSKQEKFYKAIECYDMALAIKEGFVAAWYNRGNAFRRQSKATARHFSTIRLMCYRGTIWAMRIKKWASFGSLSKVFHVPLRWSRTITRHISDAEAPTTRLNSTHWRWMITIKRLNSSPTTPMCGTLRAICTTTQTALRNR